MLTVRLCRLQRPYSGMYRIHLFTAVSLETHALDTTLSLRPHVQAALGIAHKLFHVHGITITITTIPLRPPRHFVTYSRLLPSACAMPPPLPLPRTSVPFETISVRRFLAYRTGKPYVAAVSGYTHAADCESVMRCDTSLRHDHGSTLAGSYIHTWPARTPC